MTPEILAYLREMSPVIGKNRNVLEIGSYNVNGSARSAIHHKTWLGVDIAEGPDVDVVLEEDDVAYDGLVESGLVLPDTLVICECLEHAKYPVDIVSAGKYAVLRAKAIVEYESVENYDRSRQLFVVTSPSYHFPYHAYPMDYWRFSTDTLRDVFFDGMDVIDMRYLDSNEGKHTTVAGIALFRR